MLASPHKFNKDSLHHSEWEIKKQIIEFDLLIRVILYSRFFKLKKIRYNIEL